jgi:hypothetical protein
MLTAENNELKIDNQKLAEESHSFKEIKLFKNKF